MVRSWWCVMERSKSRSWAPPPPPRGGYRTWKWVRRAASGTGHMPSTVSIFPHVYSINTEFRIPARTRQFQEQVRPCEVANTARFQCLAPNSWLPPRDAGCEGLPRKPWNWRPGFLGVRGLVQGPGSLEPSPRRRAFNAGKNFGFGQRLCEKILTVQHQEFREVLVGSSAGIAHIHVRVSVRTRRSYPSVFRTRIQLGSRGSNRRFLNASRRRHA
ncbi:hypothetical protein VTK26DRAFT_7093 [Humicola hyalothermophila]